MPVRPKTFLKQAKSKKKKEQKLETADDYQAAGVDFEDAAGKHRGGDPIKSTRFFHRALEVYEQGLARFPASFDLAYNKARVQLELATHPVLVKQLTVPILDALQAALQSHRYALSLDQDNTDTIFNTSQVLTSIAEEIAKNDNHSDAEAVPILEEALELQSRCLSLQEFKLEESTTSQQDSESAASEVKGESDDEDGGASLDSADVAQEERWFSIVEPITSGTLIDTILAQLGTLTTLCGVLSNTPGVAPPATLAWIEEYSGKLLNDRLPHYAKDNRERLSEIALCKANFICSLLEAGFRSSKLDAETYRRELDAAFAVSELTTPVSFDTLASQVRALISFNGALAESLSDEQTMYAQTRWTALTTAMSASTKLSTLPDLMPEDKAKSHLLRGDISLLQHHMSQAPLCHQPAVSNKAQLLRNAEVFYRNASKLSSDGEEQIIAGLRSAVAIFLQTGERSAMSTVAKSREEKWLRGQVEDMVLEGLIPQDVVAL